MTPLFTDEQLKKAKQTDLLPLKCLFCGNTFHKTKRRIVTFKNPNTKYWGDYCSDSCSLRGVRVKLGLPLSEIVLCKNCGEPTEKTPSQINPKGNFCSRSCSATFNNQKFPKRQYESKLCSCGKRIKHDTLQCVNCLKQETRIERESKTLKESILRSASRAKFNSIRKWARDKMKENSVERKCKFCDFDQILEVCHIKPIASFPLTAKISDVNSLKNLVYLCPNHHVLLDRGLISLKNSPSQNQTEL